MSDPLQAPSWITLMTRELQIMPSSTDWNRRGSDDALYGNGLEARIAFIADDVRRRLGPSCSHWDESEFETLVDRIARMKSRWVELGRAD